jgi:hypothetical protein
MAGMRSLCSLVALPLAVAAAPLACVVWPQGAGPGARAIPLAEALTLRDRGDAVLIDVRSREAYAEGHIPGALNVASYEVEAQAATIRKMDRLPILYCG